MWLRETSCKSIWDTSCQIRVDYTRLLGTLHAGPAWSVPAYTYFKLHLPMHITPLRALAHCWLPRSCCSGTNFGLTTTRSRLVTLFIENSFAAGVWQLWVNVVLFYLLKEWKPNLIDTGVHNPAHKVSRFCFKVCDTVHVSATSALIVYNWKMRSFEFYTGLSSVDGCITSILRDSYLWFVMISPEEHYV